MGRLRIDRLTGPPAGLRSGDGRLVSARCHTARTWRARLVGLLGTPALGDDEALWIERCGAVHTIGLRAAIGCAFLDDAGRVLRVVDPLPSGRAAAVRGARSVVECPAGTLAGVRPGDHLHRV
ncbi:MAG: DUF192 domain-containing protein [Thermoleophilia bacterium]|nr:DUF192 domain-containing protein [Thermoleophilia bacterium]